MKPYVCKKRNLLLYCTLSYIVELIGSDKVCLGTDYPFPLGELEPGKLIHSMQYSEQTEQITLSVSITSK